MGKLLQNTAFRMALILLLGILAYSNTFDVPFVFDDVPNIVENPLIRDISNVPSYFTRLREPFGSRPLMHATNALNYYLHGLDPTGYHIVNLALHLLNGVLLYFLIVMTGRHLGHSEKDTGLVAALSALLFVVHPVQTEGVTYAVSRSMLLATAFYFSGLILFLKSVTSEKRRGLYIAGLFLAAFLGMASRENFSTFPLMLVLYDLFFISHFRLREVLRHWKSYLPVAASMAYLAFLALNNTYDKDMDFTVGIPPYEYILTQFNVHWTYIRLLFLPVGQNLDYDYPTATTLFEFPTMLSFLGYLALWAAALALVRKRPVVSFGVLWFLVTLLPISFAVTVMGLRLGDVIFEHRLYLPGVGIIVATVSGAVMLSGRYRKAREGVLALFIVAALIFSAATYMRNTIWQSGISLWEDVVRKSPGKARGFNNLGRNYGAIGMSGKAVEHYQTALKLRPDYPEAHNNIAIAYWNAGLAARAIEHAQAAIKLRPSYVDAYDTLGLAYLSKNLYGKAIRHFRAAVALDPNYAKTYSNLGIAYASAGRLGEAIANFQTALRLNPQLAGVHYNLGLAYREKGLEDKAQEHFRIAENLRQKSR